MRTICLSLPKRMLPRTPWCRQAPNKQDWFLSECTTNVTKRNFVIEPEWGLLQNEFQVSECCPSAAEQSRDSLGGRPSTIFSKTTDSPRKDDLQEWTARKGESLRWSPVAIVAFSPGLEQTEVKCCELWSPDDIMPASQYGDRSATVQNNGQRDMACRVWPVS